MAALSACGVSARAAEVSFLEEEARVVSAGRREVELSRAPATVYVVTGRQIRESGAQTLWEALRGVPGVDVISARAMRGEVGIRGLNGALNNRTLVLIDGRPVLNGVYDFALWEQSTAMLEDIDRIEIVEGPVSALYGPNAISGVINIITKRPEDVGRAAVTVSGGERDSLFGSALSGRRFGPWAYKVGLSRRAADGFEASEGQASQTAAATALVSRETSAAGTFELSGGLNNHRTQVTVPTVGAPVDDGITGFVRGDWRRLGTHVRGFWNYGRSTLRDAPPLTDLDYDLFDAEATQAFSPAAGHEAVAGAGYRRVSSRSSLYGPVPDHAQDLWSLFFEDSWTPFEQVRVDFAGRLDRHPLTGHRFSPRGSVLYEFLPEQSLRAGAGTAFRNPTLVENYVSLAQRVGPAVSTIQGREDLGPERITQYELAYLGRFSSLKARVSAFHYRIVDYIAFTEPQLVSAAPPAFVVPTQNTGGTRAWGWETQLEAPLKAGLSAIASYSFQRLKDDSDSLDSADSAPRHKASGELVWRRGGWTLSTSAHWVDRTAFRSNPTSQPFVETETLPDYWLFNGRVGYLFGGKLDGLEAAIGGWNLADRGHRELGAFIGGERLRRRIMASASYRFP